MIGRGRKQVMGLKAWRRPEMKGWIHESVNGWRDSRSSSNLITDGMNMNMWAHTGLCVCVCGRAHKHRRLCSFWSCLVRLEARRRAHCCVCLPVCSSTMCSARRAPLLWQLPAARGLEKWHHGEPIYLQAPSACLCYSAVVSAVCVRVCVLRSWKRIGSDHRASWHQINFNPHKRGKKWKKREEVSCI